MLFVNDTVLVSNSVENLNELSVRIREGVPEKGVPEEKLRVNVEKERRRGVASQRAKDHLD